VVSSGLEPKDKVIVRGLQKVFFPGMPVAPTAIAMGEEPRSAADIKSAAADPSARPGKAGPDDPESKDAAPGMAAANKQDADPVAMK
jgi:hypothetical protein